MTFAFFELIVTCLQLTQELSVWAVGSESVGYCSLEEFFTFLGDSSQSVICLVESISPLLLCESLVTCVCVLVTLLLLFESCVCIESIVTCVHLTQQLRHSR